MKNQFYPGLIKGFLVSTIIWYMPVTIRGQVPPAPTPGITNNSGTTQISCAVSAINVTATGGISYEWSNGLGTDANAVITEAGTYTVTVKDAADNTMQASITITESLNGPPAPAIVDGLVNVCNYIGTADRLTYTTATVTGASSYEWMVPATVNILSGQGTNSITVSLNDSFAASGNKQLRVRAIAPCGMSMYTIKYLAAQMPGSVAMISGPADMCPYLGNGLNATYSIPAVSNATSYHWNVPPGANIQENNGSNIKVGFDNSFTTGNITVSASNGCGSSNTRSLTVKRTLLATPGMITGTPNACMLMPSIAYPSGMTATYSVPKITGNTYNWAVPDGVSMNSHGSTATTDFIDVNFTPAYTGGDISVVATNGCGVSPPRIFKMASLSPSTPSTITSTFIQACPERLYQYSLSSMPSNAVSTQWTVPASGTITSGQGTATIVVSYPGYTTGTVSVSSNNGCGNSAIRSLNVVIPQCQPEFTGINNSNNSTTGKAGQGEVNEPMKVNVLSNHSYTGFVIQVLTKKKERINARLMDGQRRMFKEFEIMPNQKMNVGAELRMGIYFIEIMQGNEVKMVRCVKL